MAQEYYGDDEPKKEAKRGQRSHVDIGGPVTAWLALLFVALALKFLTAGVQASGGAYALFAGIANFILYTPGDIILPLVVGAAIGAEIGKRAGTLRKAQLAGVINGVYASVVYAIGIIVIYEVLNYGVLNAAGAGVALSLDFLLLSWIAIPIAICILLTVIFAMLSYSRKVSP
jgi:hypothetical protein